MTIIEEALGTAREHMSRGSFNAAEIVFRNVLNADPKQPGAWHDLGTLALRERKTDAAIDCFQQALALLPSNCLFHNSMGVALEAAGRLAEAEEHLKEAIRLKPDFQVGHFNLGNVLRARGQAGRALESYKRAIALGPHAASLVNTGVLLKEAGRREEAIVAFRKAIEINPNLAQAHANLGAALQVQQKVDQALDCYRRAQEIQPGFPDAVCGEAAILDMRGEVDQAYEKLKPMLDSPRATPETATVFASIARHFKKTPEALALLRQVLERPRLTNRQRAALLFASGRLHDSLGEYDAAFRFFQQANTAVPRNFQAEKLHAEIDALIESFTRESLAAAPHASNDSDLPVFIVGMPRSGTSLVEQIIASHPQAYGAGELHLLNKMVAGISQIAPTEPPYPAGMKSFTPEVLDVLADSYLRELRAFSDKALRITDKLPGNFVHLGLIQLLFPRSRVIHVVRHPLDTCLSCYFQGFNVGHEFSYDLRHLGFVYQAYQKLMAHWVNAGIRMLEVRYEELVADQESGTRRIIEFCGLDWDERCLRFHETRRLVKTASYDQVRRPLYDKSVARYRNYQQHLGPLREALGLPGE